jgi:hypothetical protein
MLSASVSSRSADLQPFRKTRKANLIGLRIASSRRDESWPAQKGPEDLNIEFPRNVEIKPQLALTL